MEIEIPELSLVVLIGASGSGKSTFARRHFRPTEVLSSDFCRGLVSNDESSQAATADAFEVLHFIAAKRLARGRLTVIDATNVQPASRRLLVATAQEYHCIPVAIVFDLPESVCEERNRGRPERAFGPQVIRRHRRLLRRSLGGLRREGFRFVRVFESEEEVNAAALRRTPLRCDRRDDHGPFDIIGDVHGCCDELEALLCRLGYEAVEDGAGDPVWGPKAYRHAGGRKAVFLGDLVDRGPRILDVLRLVRNMVSRGFALAAPGNHDIRLLRALRGRKVRVTHGLDRTLAEIDALAEDGREATRAAVAEFLGRMVSHYVLDGGRLVVAHAGMKHAMQGRASRRVRDFALYGETTGETDEFGLPVRYDWAAEYRGAAAVVYGHTPVPETEWLNRTVNIDTGCVFGGKLTALRYPEKEFVSVDATRAYCEPVRPLGARAAAGLTAQQQYDDLLDAEDVIGKRVITTRLRPAVTVREGNAAAALEVMSRFAVDPKWLIYLPPTMSPCETSTAPGFLERPEEGFSYYRSAGASRVVCEEKHMGSRAVAVVCRDDESARRRFGIVEDGAGVIYTRTGRRFFEDRAVEGALVGRIRSAMDKAGFWERFATEWACLDCELMPWSAKAQDLLKGQYAALAAAARASLPQAISAIERTAGRADVAKGAEVRPGSSARPADAGEILARYRRRLEAVEQYVAVYRRYCWAVTTVDDLKLAPFHLMATEGKAHVDRDHLWHMERTAELCAADPRVLLPTAYRVVDLADEASTGECARWWEEMTAEGGEGMVVKPLDFVVRRRGGLAQPGVKVRGREYLRIIYGPEYTAEEHLQRLRVRYLGSKRSLAVREFALGVEALERFVHGEPLRRVHECVFGVLALESEPVDPRL